MTMRTIVPAEGAILERILETTYPSRHDGLSRHAFAKCDTALRSTPWALHHEQRFALVEGTNVLASAQRQDLTATLDGRDVRAAASLVCSSSLRATATGMKKSSSNVCSTMLEPTMRSRSLWIPAHHRCRAPEGFEPIPTDGRGAPGSGIIPTRRSDDARTWRRGPRLGGNCGDGKRSREPISIPPESRRRPREVRDHQETAAGRSRDSGRSPTPVRDRRGRNSAAAYVVISIAGGIWTIEECGDRDSSAARVGAILQALIAREPAELRPVIRGWLPPGLVPPQATILSAQPSGEVVMVKVLSATIEQPRLSAADVLYWRSDIF